MIPRPGDSLTVKRELEDIAKEARAGESEVPYFEYEWFGEVHSYSAAGFWMRIAFSALAAALAIAVLLVNREAVYAMLFAVVIGGGIVVSLLMLTSYRRRL